MPQRIEPSGILEGSQTHFQSPGRWSFGNCGRSIGLGDARSAGTAACLRLIPVILVVRTDCALAQAELAAFAFLRWRPEMVLAYVRTLKNSPQAYEPQRHSSE